MPAVSEPTVIKLLPAAQRPLVLIDNSGVTGIMVCPRDTVLRKFCSAVSCHVVKPILELAAGNAEE